MKKLLLSLASFLMISGLAVADVKIVKLDDTSVEITYTYKNDDFTEMNVIGNFIDWKTPGVPMTKNAQGLWEAKVKASSVDMIQYKFFSGGEWMTDENAPDFKDDGFGGENGLIPVADVLSGAIALPGAAPAPGAAAAAPAAGARQRLTFSTATFVEAEGVASVNKDEFAVAESGLNAKSIWTLKGDLAPRMPGYLEVTAFKGNPRFYKGGNVMIDDGMKSLAAGVLINPFYYLGDNKRPSLDKFSFGFDTPWISYETGYMNSVFPTHKAILWTTVADDVKAVQGYSSFRLAPELRTLGDITVDAAFIPNKSLDNMFGLVTWANIAAYGGKFEVQYEMKASQADATKYFQDPNQTNIILGGEYTLGDYYFAGQFLNSAHEKKTFKDLAAASTKIAFKLVGGYKAVDKSGEWLLGIASRGSAYNKNESALSATSGLLYGKSSDELGELGTMKVSLNGFQLLNATDKFSLESSFTMPMGENKSKNSVVSLKPGYLFALDLGTPLTVDSYIKVAYNTEPAAGTDAFDFNSLGAKASFSGYDVYYKLNNGVKSSMFNTLLVETKVEAVTVQGGVGLRTGSAVNNPFGIFAGAAYTLDVPEIRSPKVYAQAVFNMDPFEGEGAAAYKLSDFGPDNGTAGYDGKAALRMGISWKY